METHRVQSPENMVDLITQECEWDVEFWVVARECCFHVFPRYVLNSGIFCDEEAVIPCNEIVLEDRMKRAKNECGKEEGGGGTGEAAKHGDRHNGVFKASPLLTAQFPRGESRSVGDEAGGQWRA